MTTANTLTTAFRLAALTAGAFLVFSLHLFATSVGV